MSKGTIKITNRWRVFWGSLLVAAPVFVFLCFVLWFRVRFLEDIEKGELRKVELQYRESARKILELDEDQRVKASLKEFKKKWPMEKVGQISNRQWGFVDTNEGNVIVWVKVNTKGDDLYIYERKPEDKTEYRKNLYIVGAPVAVLILSFMIVGIVCLINAEKGKGLFVEAAIHDLRLPLASMLVSAELSDDENLKISVMRLKYLVENMRICVKNGRVMTPQKTELDLKDTYDRIYTCFKNDFRRHFGGKDIKLESKGNSFFVCADDMMVDLIIWNLLSNEEKYAANKGPVKVFIEEKDEVIEISFIDVGVGLTKKEMGKVFNKYYRAKSLMQSGKGGSGLGLFNARQLARLMGGDVTVKSNTPHGCIFTLSLPKIKG